METNKGGCCIARYVGGGRDGGSFLPSKIDRIMLRFRPIAPRPAASSGPAAAPPPRPEAAVGSKRRGAREGRRCRNKRQAAAVEGKSLPVVTLPLLPETPDRKESPPRDVSPLGSSSSSTSSSPSGSSAKCPPIWYPGGEIGSFAPPSGPAWSCVTLESVTAGSLDGWDLDGAGEGKRCRLEADACPAFITDAWNGVRWVNEAYRRMVGQAEGGGVVVALVAKAKLPDVHVPAFTCRVRLQYTREREKSSLTVPCDVCRLAGGGCAWRLDVKAALSLGRQTSA